MVSQRENCRLEFRPEALNSSIGERFAQVAACIPEASAIIDQDASWTYAELNEQSDRLASAIAETQTAGQEPILLLFDRAAMAIAAMLACIKIGRPYVPLSPSNPRLRIDHIRESSGAMLLLTEPSCARLAKQIASSDFPVIETPAIAAVESVPRPLLPVSADALVWILFTSGSTGLPKGVMQTHRNILHYTLSYTQALALSCADRIGLLFSYASNVANHEILAALLNGAAICPFDVRQHGISPLSEWLEKTEITVYSSVPTLFRRFVEDLPGTQRFPSLRHVKLVGEPVYKRDLEAFRAHFATTCSFINRLGSTETGTIRSYFADASTEIDGVNVPVGFSVPDNDIVLLDDARHPVPAGEPGEIVVRSRYLSPGYWRCPDLTEKAFFGEGDRRCFHTGDVGLMLPGECLVHLGRRDTQIKVRGYRIEIGEIESALLEHPAVGEVIVLAREDHPDDPQLVAYFTIKQGELKPTVSELRRPLADRLPDYMVPNAFVSLLEFPLAPNGKIDRSALPPVGTERPRLETAYVAPRTPIEQELARLWGKLLHLEDIGIQDNFLDLGGHSLLAMRMITRMREAFSVDLGIRCVLENLSIEALTVHVLEKMMAADNGESEADNTENGRFLDGSIGANDE